MRAICPTCDTAYTIPDARIGASGRKVRCVKCGEQWHVTLPIEDRLDADAPPAPLAAAPSAPPPDATREPTVDTVDEDHWASVAQHFEGGTDTASPSDAVAVDVSPRPDGVDPVESDAAGGGSDGAPEVKAPRAVTAGARRFTLRRPSMGRSLQMPALPIGVIRATPFFGPLVFVTAVLVAVSLLTFRTSVVAAVPGLSGLYAAIGLEVNLRGLTFGQIETLREIDNGQPVLVVEGSLANPTKEPRDVPALRFALRDGDNQELYAWSIDPKATSIAAGDTLRFRTRLVAPPDRAADLQIRFVERRNHSAELK
jgi:predicted Zn finger-like uncharacterized protein